MTDDTTTTTTPDASTTPVTEAQTPTTAPDQTQIPDWAKDPTAALKIVNDLRAENARDRTAAKTAAATEARNELLKQLGLKPDDKPVAPEDHQRALSEKDTVIRNLTIKNALSDALTTSNAKPIARAAILGDGILDGLDPNSATFATDVNAKVSAYLTSNPELKAAAQAASSSGTDTPGGDAPKTTYTRAQLKDQAFYQANKADIEAAYADGRIVN